VAEGLRLDERAGLDEALLERLGGFYRGLRNYFRLRADGLEHIPTQGPALLVANHTGWLGFDYALTALTVQEELGRYVRGMVHPAWFRAEATAKFARSVGLFEVSKDAMRAQLAHGRLVMVFPEGEKGAFRPGSNYELEEFARGFVRVALESGVPVVPVAILGGEEANPIGRRIDNYEDLLQFGIPVPKNLVPKPVKWRLRFLPPLNVAGAGPADADNRERVHALSEATRQAIAAELQVLKEERGHPYF
jgi:1-acyl-sn-glycerol-3-phosphate acyltransferase